MHLCPERKLADCLTIIAVVFHELSSLGCRLSCISSSLAGKVVIDFVISQDFIVIQLHLVVKTQELPVLDTVLKLRVQILVYRDMPIFVCVVSVKH